MIASARLHRIIVAACLVSGCVFTNAWAQPSDATGGVAALMDQGVAALAAEANAPSEDDVATPAPLSSEATPPASLPVNYRDYRVSLALTGAFGFGIPSDNPVLYADETQMVSGFAVAAPSWTLQLPIRVGERWELIPVVSLQSVFVSSGVYAEWGGDLRARVFPGDGARRWQEFYQFGVGYGRVVHVVRAEGAMVSGENEIPIRELDRTQSGPYRMMMGGGARWNASRLFALDFFANAWLYVPDISVNFELGVGLALRF